MGLEPINPGNEGEPRGQLAYEGCRSIPLNSPDSSPNSSPGLRDLPPCPRMRAIPTEPGDVVRWAWPGSGVDVKHPVGTNRPFGGVSLCGGTLWGGCPHTMMRAWAIGWPAPFQGASSSVRFRRPAPLTGRVMMPTQQQIGEMVGTIARLRGAALVPFSILKQAGLGYPTVVVDDGTVISWSIHLQDWCTAHSLRFSSASTRDKMCVFVPA